MSESSPVPARLPARPSLEQLQKRAKELLKRYRSGDSAATERLATIENPTLADAQFVLAREHGFQTWAQLKHHIAALPPPELGKYEKLANDVAAAYMAGDMKALREINWSLGTSFISDYDSLKMQQRLSTWFASSSRAPELALADARTIVARSYGFADWASFVENLAKPQAPLYRLDWKENAIGLRGPSSERDWEAVCSAAREHRLTKLFAGGATDAAMEQVTRLEHVTHLLLANSNLLTDDGAQLLARMPQLEALALGGPKSILTDRALAVLRHLPNLRELHLSWTPGITDAGMVHLAGCQHLETVDLMGTPTGDGAIRALAGKPKLRLFKSGRGVTDEALPLLHQFPVFKRWQGGESHFDLMTFEAQPNHLFLDGPFTDAGLAALAGLDGIAALTFFWHCSGMTSAGLAPLRDLPNLRYLGCQDKNCDDDAMRHIATIPGLRMLMGQGTVATDVGFAALSRSQTLEYFWGRDCPNLTGRGFTALSAIPSLRGLGVSCKHVDDTALARLPHFPALRELMPMDVSDDGFRHVGQCRQLERLWCMYCRDTGDRATEHISSLSNLRTYYAGQTLITDRSLELLGKIHSLESLEFWACAEITSAGAAHLASLPRLREISFDGSAKVTRDVLGLFPPHVHVKHS